MKKSLKREFDIAGLAWLKESALMWRFSWWANPYQAIQSTIVKKDGKVQYPDWKWIRIYKTIMVALAHMASEEADNEWELGSQVNTESYLMKQFANLFSP